MHHVRQVYTWQCGKAASLMCTAMQCTTARAPKAAAHAPRQVAYKDRALAAAAVRAERERAAARQRDDELATRAAGVQAELQARTKTAPSPPCCQRAERCDRRGWPGGSTASMIAVRRSCPRKAYVLAACAAWRARLCVACRARPGAQGQLQALRAENKCLAAEAAAAAAAGLGSTAALRSRLGGMEGALTETRALAQTLNNALRDARAEAAALGDARAEAAALRDARAEAAGAQAATEARLADAQARSCRRHLSEYPFSNRAEWRAPASADVALRSGWLPHARCAWGGSRSCHAAKPAGVALEARLHAWRLLAAHVHPVSHALATCRRPPRCACVRRYNLHLCGLQAEAGVLRTRLQDAEAAAAAAAHELAAELAAAHAEADSLRGAAAAAASAAESAAAELGAARSDAGQLRSKAGAAAAAAAQGAAELAAMRGEAERLRGEATAAAEADAAARGAAERQRACAAAAERSAAAAEAQRRVRMADPHLIFVS
jgi:hypothetical protein